MPLHRMPPSPPSNAFTDAERQALYHAIYARRDVRSYLPDPVSDELLARLLDAAHHAPSVGFMQPWNFVVVRDVEQKRRVHAHFLEVNARASQVFEDDRRRAYQALKLQGILDAPVNLLVTCDTTRGGEHVLGRFTTPETDVYSTCLAIQNLWLAARAEGVGVGWMSIMDARVVAELLRVPAHVVPVAYLALGFPVEVREVPLLSQVGWRARLPLADLVFDDVWGTCATGVVWSTEATASREASALGPIREPEERRADTLPELSQERALQLATERNDSLLKPRGSLGELERVALKLAARQGRMFPRCDHAQLVLFAGDHGVTVEGVSAYKRETTVKMVYSYLAGGAVVNALARQHSLPVHIVDVGVDHDFGVAEGLIGKKVARGTRNLACEPAMTRAECEAALTAGRDVVRALPVLDVLVLGEMGIGNSTSAAALTAALLERDAGAVTGIGTGLSDQGLANKRAVVERALALHAHGLPEQDAPYTLLSRLGGFEIAAMVGAMEAAHERGVLVLLDGFIVGAAALLAVRQNPAILPSLLAGHVGTEPGHVLILEALGLRPLLSLELRLGEGSGAVLALSLLRSACAVMREVRTFEEANMPRPERRDGEQ